MIQIIKYKTRASVKFQYDPVVLSIIRPIERKYWDQDKKIWTIPISALESFKKSLLEKNYSVDLIDFDLKTHADITDNGDTIEFKFNCFVNNIEPLKEIECTYDYSNRKWQCSSDKLQKLVDILNDQGITHSITVNPKSFDIPDSQLMVPPKTPKKGRPNKP